MCSGYVTKYFQTTIYFTPLSPSLTPNRSSNTSPPPYLPFPSLIPIPLFTWALVLYQDKGIFTVIKVTKWLLWVDPCLTQHMKINITWEMSGLLSCSLSHTHDAQVYISRPCIQGWLLVALRVTWYQGWKLVSHMQCIHSAHWAPLHSHKYLFWTCFDSEAAEFGDCHRAGDDPGSQCPVHNLKTGPSVGLMFHKGYIVGEDTALGISQCWVNQGVSSSPLN